MAKNIKKDLKQPDEFVSFWTKAGAGAREFYASRQRAVLIGAGALVLVVVGTLIFSAVAEKRAIRASQALDRVQKIATAELVPEGATSAPASDGVPRFKTEKERLEAALKELDGFLSAQPGNPLREEALLQRGSLLLSLERADEALAVYNQLVDSGKLDNRLRFLAHEGQGYAHERKGDLDRALASFGKLGDDAAGMPGFYKDRALYQKARLTELRGNRNDAAKLYQEVLDKNPNTSLRDEITNRLAVLELK